MNNCFSPSAPWVPSRHRCRARSFRQAHDGRYPLKGSARALSPRSVWVRLFQLLGLRGQQLADIHSRLRVMASPAEALLTQERVEDPRENFTGLLKVI